MEHKKVFLKGIEVVLFKFQTYLLTKLFSLSFPCDSQLQLMLEGIHCCSFCSLNMQSLLVISQMNVALPTFAWHSPKHDKTAIHIWSLKLNYQSGMVFLKTKISTMKCNLRVLSQLRNLNSSCRHRLIRFFADTRQHVSFSIFPQMSKIFYNNWCILRSFNSLT